MRSRIEAVSKLGYFFQRLSELKISKNAHKSSPGALLARFAGSPYPFLLVIGLISAFVFCSAVSGVIASLLMEEQLALADVISRRAPSPFVSQEISKPRDSGIDFAAFKALEANPASADKEEVAEAKPIDTFRLVGTLPRVGAWINVDNATSLVLRSQEFNGYVLEYVDRGDVLFTREGESFPLFLNLSDPKTAAPPQTPPPAQAPPQPPQGGPQNASISQAGFNGDEGTLTRELLNDIMSNPMQLLSTVRLVPDGDGMRVVRIRQDNLLAQFGIKQADLLTGINGIAINSGTDMMNVMKSLLQGNRFDLQLTRGQESGMLRYSVR